MSPADPRRNEVVEMPKFFISCPPIIAIGELANNNKVGMRE